MSGTSREFTTVASSEVDFTQYKPVERRCPPGPLLTRKERQLVQKLRAIGAFEVKKLSTPADPGISGKQERRHLQALLDQAFHGKSNNGPKANAAAKDEALHTLDDEGRGEALQVQGQSHLFVSHGQVSAEQAISGIREFLGDTARSDTNTSTVQHLLEIREAAPSDQCRRGRSSTRTFRKDKSHVFTKEILQPGLQGAKYARRGPR